MRESCQPPSPGATASAPHVSRLTDGPWRALAASGVIALAASGVIAWGGRGRGRGRGRRSAAGNCVREALSSEPLKGTWGEKRAVPEPPTREKLPHVRSPTHRTAVIDNSVTTTIEQPSGVRVLFSLTRTDVVTQYDLIERLPRGGFQIVPGGDVAQRFERVFEFTADLAPDQALTIVNNLLAGLQQLPQTRKQQ
jgi:hypothetical protein